MYHVAHDTLHVMRDGCVTREMHMIAPWSLERTSWRQFAAQGVDSKKLLVVVVVVAAAAAAV